MSLTSNVSFNNAQAARKVLMDAGWMPLCKVQTAETFVRNAQRCMLCYEGNVPAEVELDAYKYVEFMKFFISSDEYVIIPQHTG